MLYNNTFYHHLDYRLVFVNFTEQRNGIEFQFSTIDDEVAFEDDFAELNHTTGSGIKEGLEQFGEFLRYSAIVKIFDNEGECSLYHVLGGHV